MEDTLKGEAEDTLEGDTPEAGVGVVPSTLRYHQLLLKAWMAIACAVL